jgi:short subunit fatty acids transporter
MSKTITIGGIFSLIGAIALLFWTIGLMSDVTKDPSNPKNVENVATKMVDESTPPQTNIIISLAPYGIGGVVLIILLILFWDKIMNYRISVPNY